MRRPDWMDPIDHRILELLCERESAVPGDEIAATLKYREAYVRERCRVLARQGLIQPIGHADVAYEPRQLGRDLLAERVSVDVVEQPPSVD